MEYLLSLIEFPDFRLRKAGDFCLGGLRHIKDHFIPHARNNYHPHILGDRSLALFSAFLVVLKIFTISLVSFGPVLPAFSSAITEDNIIALTNQSRTDYNLGALTENSVLDKAAQAKADDMLAKGYFAHTSPDGRTPWDFITGAGYNYLMAGENLAVNFAQAEDVETAWMNSPGHKANILNRNFEDIGIGIAQGVFQGHTAIFVVQEFGVPAEQKITITDTPTPVQTAAVPPPQLASDNVKGASDSPVKLAVTDGQTQMQDGQVNITAKISGNPVKAVAYFGDPGTSSGTGRSKAVMLSPKTDGSWVGQASLSELAAGQSQVRIKVFDIKGQTAEMQLADFTNGTIQNYNVVATDAAAPVKVSWLGRVFDPKNFEQRLYLIIIAGILASMILAIGIKRHIQHLNLIANSSFVVMLACLLWMAG